MIFTNSATGESTVLEKNKQKTTYPEGRVIVLDDDINTFEHVIKTLCRIIPSMNEDKARALANKIDQEGLAQVWQGPLEQAELYHLQLSNEGLTMAPLERT